MAVHIIASNQSMTFDGSKYVGTVTLTTDADVIRISREVGSITGNSGGSDDSYYYVKSGDIMKSNPCISAKVARRFTKIR